MLLLPHAPFVPALEWAEAGAPAAEKGKRLQFGAVILSGSFQVHIFTPLDWVTHCVVPRCLFLVSSARVDCKQAGCARCLPAQGSRSGAKSHYQSFIFNSVKLYYLSGLPKGLFCLHRAVLFSACKAPLSPFCSFWCVCVHI